MYQHPDLVIYPRTSLEEWITHLESSAQAAQTNSEALLVGLSDMALPWSHSALNRAAVDRLYRALDDLQPEATWVLNARRPTLRGASESNSGDRPSDRQGSAEYGRTSTMTVTYPPPTSPSPVRSPHCV